MAAVVSYLVSNRASQSQLTAHYTMHFNPAPSTYILTSRGTYYYLGTCLCGTAAVPCNKGRSQQLAASAAAAAAGKILFL